MKPSPNRVATKYLRLRFATGQPLLVVYGEAHFFPGDVNRVRKLVVKQNPELILHELPWDDKSYYAKKLPLSDFRPLETRSIDKSKPLAKQFLDREKNMLSNISQAISTGGLKSVAVVVGDTHLRTIHTEELGPPTLRKGLSRSRAKIIRSPHREIK